MACVLCIQHCRIEAAAFAFKFQEQSKIIIKIDVIMTLLKIDFVHFSIQAIFYEYFRHVTFLLKNVFWLSH